MLPIEELSADNINLTNYVATIEFTLACADFFDNQGDIDFIIKLPVKLVEFKQLHQTQQERFVNIIKSHIMYFEGIGDRVVEGKNWGKLDKARQESAKKIVSETSNEMKIFKQELLETEPAPTQESEPVSPTVVDNEKVAMVNTIKKLSSKVKAQSLTIQTGRPNKEQMMHYIDDGCRKRNGKCNNEAVGRKLGIDGETAKRWIEDLGLSNYAYNPNHIETFHRKK